MLRGLTTLTAAAALLAAVSLAGTANAQNMFPFDSGDLVAYYSFDASNGGLDATDDSSNSNDGTVTNATADCGDTPATFGNSCSAVFDGDGDIVEAANESNFDLTTFTLAFWFNLQGTSSDNNFPRAVSKGNSTTSDGSYSVWVRDDGTDEVGQRVIEGGSNLDTVDPTPGYAIGEWHHVASSFNATTCERILYFDGVQVDSNSSGTAPCTPDNVANPFSIGAVSGAANEREFNGKLDEVRVYSRVLTSDEIAALASAGAIIVNDDTSDGSASCANPDWGTVQEGIDAVTPELLTVLVCPGLYEEDIAITTDGVKLIGDDKPTTIIKGVATVPGASFPLAVPNVDIQANDVWLKYLTFESPDVPAASYSSGIVLAGAGIKIAHNKFLVGTGDVSQGIQTYRDDNAPPGLRDISGLYIGHNWFTHLSPPTGTEAYEAVFLNHQSDAIGSCGYDSAVVVKDNHFSGNLIRAVTTERSCTKILENTITTDLGALFGSFPRGVQVGDFDVREVTDVYVKGNDITHMFYGVIFRDGVSDSAIAYNTVNHSISNGIRLFVGADDNEVKNNGVGHSIDSGIVIESDDNEVSKNTSHHNGLINDAPPEDDGIHLTAASIGNDVNGNNTHHNRD